MLFFQLPPLTLSLSHSLVLTVSLLLLLDPRPFSVSFLICTSGKKYQSQAGSTNWPPPQPIPNPKININLPYFVHQHDLSNNIDPSPSHSLHCCAVQRKKQKSNFQLLSFPFLGSLKKIHTHLFCQTYNIYCQTKWLLSGSDLHFYHLVCLFKLSQAVTTSPMNPPKRNICWTFSLWWTWVILITLSTFKMRYKSSTPASQKSSM